MVSVSDRLSNPAWLVWVISTFPRRNHIQKAENSRVIFLPRLGLLDISNDISRHVLLDWFKYCRCIMKIAKRCRKHFFFFLIFWFDSNPRETSHDYLNVRNIELDNCVSTWKKKLKYFIRINGHVCDCVL